MSKLSPIEEKQYAVSLKGMTHDQLFEAWSHEYDARKTEHVRLIVAEMNTRNLDEKPGVISL